MFLRHVEEKTLLQQIIQIYFPAHLKANKGKILQV